MNSPVPITARPTDQRSIVPAAARPKATAMMTQPIVSSRMAEATMICPRSRRMKFISRTTTATILTEEIASAVPRKMAVTTLVFGSGRNSAGRNSPRAKPHANGTATPASATAIAARPTRRTSCRSVSMPVNSNSIRMPSSETASIMLFCAPSMGKTACCPAGHSTPKNDGPSSKPPISWPITEG